MMMTILMLIIIICTYNVIIVCNLISLSDHKWFCWRSEAKKSGKQVTLWQRLGQRLSKWQSVQLTKWRSWKCAPLQCRGNDDGNDEKGLFDNQKWFPPHSNHHLSIKVSNIVWEGAQVITKTTNNNVKCCVTEWHGLLIDHHRHHHNYDHYHRHHHDHHHHRQ